MSSNGDDSSPQPKKNVVVRRKLPIARIERESNRQVTFSKRRSGVFKKANELCTLTGSEAALVVFSPSNKAFSYGHPNVQDVMNRFLNYPGWNFLSNPENPEAKELLDELASTESLVEAQKARRRELQETWDQLASENKLATPSAIAEMSYDELKNLKASMLELKSRIENEKQRGEAAGGGEGCSVEMMQDVEMLDDGVSRRFF